MSMMEAVQTVFQKYIDPNGRASRSEYWYFVLFNFCVGLVLGGLHRSSRVSIFGWISVLYGLAVILPEFMVEIRRLHDIGKSGLCILFVLIPVVGPILMLYWLCKDSQVGYNEYGPNPKGIGNVYDYDSYDSYGSYDSRPRF